MPNTNTGLSCQEIITTRYIKKPNGNGYFELKYQLPTKEQFMEYLRKNGENDEEDIDYMANVYCQRMEKCSTAEEAWKEFCTHYKIDHSWWEKDFEFVFKNMLVTLSGFPLKDRLKESENYLLQRGPFGQDGLDAKNWLESKGLFYSDDPANFIPIGRAMKEYEYEIKKFMLRMDIDETVKKIKKFREDSNEFSLFHGFSKWMDENGLGGSPQCSCSCSRAHSKRHTDKINRRRRHNEMSTNNTTGEKLAAAALGTTAVTGTAAAILGTGTGTVATGSIASTAAGALGAAGVTAGNATSAALASAAASTATGLAGWSLGNVAILLTGCGIGATGTAIALGCWNKWGRGKSNYQLRSEEDGRSSARQKLKELKSGRKSSNKPEKGLELSLLR